MSIHDSRELAIELTRIMLEFGKTYKYCDLELYMLQGTDGTSYNIVLGNKKKLIFTNAYEASQKFAELAWEIKASNKANNNV